MYKTEQLRSDRNPFEINSKSIPKIMKFGYVVQNILINIFHEDTKSSFDCKRLVLTLKPDKTRFAQTAPQPSKYNSFSSQITLESSEIFICHRHNYH